MSEEELQKQIERGTGEPSSADAESYRRVFSSLRRETDFHLSPGFADKVMKKVEYLRSKEASRERWWFFGGIFIFLIGLVVALTQIEFKPGVGVYTFVAGYKGLLLFGVAFILLLNYLDKKFIRPLKN